MTVCIAAICEDKQYILTASDRMVTAGDIEFEPEASVTPKIFALSPRVLALVADQIPPQATICADVSREFGNERPDATVREVAESYSAHFAKYRLRQATQNILSPQGLDLTDYHKMIRKGTSSEMLDKIQLDMHEAELECQAIITGVDETGAHIYVVTDPGVESCQDGVGFAAIGGGAWHAESQFMLARYTRRWPFARSLFLMYLAKSRAEIAPGVGKETDMYLIGPKRVANLEPAQYYTRIPDNVTTRLKVIYLELESQEIENRQKAYDASDVMWKEPEKNAEARAAQEKQGANIPPVDNKETVSGDPEERQPKD